MTEDEIHILELQALQRSANALDQSLAIERVALIDTVVQPPIELGGDQVAAAPPAELLECRSQQLFRPAAGIDLGAVKEVDTAVVGGRHALCRSLVVQLIAEGNPGAVRELADADPSPAQMTIFHAIPRTAYLNLPDRIRSIRRAITRHDPDLSRHYNVRPV